MRKEITWISPLRTGIILAAILAVVSIVRGILGVIFGLMDPGGPGATIGDGIGALLMLGGIGAGLLVIIMGIIMGFIVGALGALVYNVAAGMVGGIVIELKDGDV